VYLILKVRDSPGLALEAGTSRISFSPFSLTTSSSLKTSDFSLTIAASWATAVAAIRAKKTERITIVLLYLMGSLLN
jgi:hypothetical protein